MRRRETACTAVSGLSHSTCGYILCRKVKTSTMHCERHDMQAHMREEECRISAFDRSLHTRTQSRSMYVDPASTRSRWQPER